MDWCLAVASPGGTPCWVGVQLFEGLTRQGNNRLWSPQGVPYPMLGRSTAPQIHCLCGANLTPLLSLGSGPPGGLTGSSRAEDV